MFNSTCGNSSYGGKSLTLSIGTIADGELPLAPALTPGWGVAGAILIITGSSYALIGIKTRWVHCFFSVAFLAAVSVTVLIVYVMSTPVKTAIQGAYVVAAVCTGVALGGAGLIFRDILECLGCLLGGFCLAMWLLTLKAGGLTGSGGAGTVIFICVFSALGLAGYFSRWTRPQYMIVCIALNGATAAVIGIDCFSRAGLKEFWAYIWDLNDNLFPYDANTYPLTKGIRVEQAVTIILMLFGIVSQGRLWNVIKEKRARREEERRKGQEALDSADLKAGGEIERINAHERSQWEAVHGDAKTPTSAYSAVDSGVGDMDSEKRSARHSGTPTTPTCRSAVHDSYEIEMAELPAEMPTHAGVPGDGGPRPEVLPRKKTAAELVMGKNEKDGMVTVRVAVDEIDAAAVHEPEDESITTTELGRSAMARLSLKPSTKPARPNLSATPEPEVVPLPFHVPQIESDEHDDGNRSSFATFASLENELPVRQSVDSKRSSFAKRLSAGSTNLLRRLSHNSLAKHLEAAQGQGPNESQEELNLPARGDRDSVAATFDEESLQGEDDARSRVDEQIVRTEIKAELTNKKEDEADTVAPELADDKSANAEDAADKDKQKTEDDEASKHGKSVTSDAESKAASLTKEHLPRALSKVALSYRTNEWAKHLSNAEIPTPDELQILEPAEPQDADVEEAAAPVNVVDLQKTAVNAAPPAAMPRTVSAMSMQQMKNQARVSSAAHRPANLTVPANEIEAGSYSKRSSSRTVVTVNEEGDNEPRLSSESRQAAVRAAAAALTGEAIPGTTPSETPNNTVSFHPRPPVPGVVSYNSPQTLIGKRDMLLRAKSQALNRPESDLRQGMNDGAAAYGAVPALGPGRMSEFADKHDTNYRMSSVQRPPVDLDDLPLNQRKALIKNESRRNSMSSSTNSPGDAVGSSRRSSFVAQRRSDLPSQVARESQQSLNFSPQQLKSYATGAGAGTRKSSSSFVPGPSAGGPLINQVYGIPGTSSHNSLLPRQTSQALDVEANRDIDMQRQLLLKQKEVEARQRESMRVQRESMVRKVERRMRTDSQMMEAHREALRKMQRGVNSG